MKQLRLLFIVLGVIVATLWGVLAWRTPETRDITTVTRSDAQGEYIQLSDGVTHYDLGGPDTARTVVLVHGFSVPMYIWDSTAVALRDAGYRVLRYDLFGRGLSDRPDASYDGTFHANQLKELLDSLGIREPVDVVGLSFGGPVSAYFTTQHRARVRTLTLMDPATERASPPGWLAWPVVGHWVWQVTRAPNAAQGQPSDFLHPERFPEWVSRYEPQMQYKGFGRALRRSVLNTGASNIDSLYDAVGRTGVPAMLIWGKQDNTTPIAAADQLIPRIPGIVFLPVDSAGHLPAMEQGGVVHPAMLAFFAAH
ncbi:MAG: alpha/beta hydrolase [Gemmatimonadaceae bacterium]|nr:alpha/beta hydrolase [Gemmatimonadaceae bacterium]